jgi:hypothetical protein
MDEYITIRDLNNAVALSSLDLIPVVIGLSDPNNLQPETRNATLNQLKNFINSVNQNYEISTLSVTDSATIAGNVGIGSVNPIAKLYVDGNVIVSGTLSALSGFYSYSTDYISTSSLFVSAGSAVGLTVKQDWEYPIAQFLDGNDIVLHIDARSEYEKRVGIRTSTPNEVLTVLGNISSNSFIYSKDTETSRSYSLSSAIWNQLSSEGNILLNTNSTSGITIIGNESSNTYINGDVFINTNLSAVSTVIGNPFGEVYIQGLTNLTNVSISGDIFINQEESLNTFTLGNVSAENLFLGNNTLSGKNEIIGDLIINDDGDGDLFVGTLTNTGSINIGNSGNRINIKAGEMSIGNVDVSDTITLTFTATEDIDGYFLENDTSNWLTSSVDIVEFDVDGVTPLVPPLTNINFSEYVDVNILSYNINNQTMVYGSSAIFMDVQGKTLGIHGYENLNLNTLGEGSVYVGNDFSSIFLGAPNININNNNKGFATSINSSFSSGDVFIGNPDGLLVTQGETYINSPSGLDTFIGNISSVVRITNLSIFGGLTADLFGDFGINNLSSVNVRSSFFYGDGSNINPVGSLYFNNTSYNTALYYTSKPTSLYNSLSTGYNNIFLGLSAGLYNQNNLNSVFIGKETGLYSVSGSNNFAIGLSCQPYNYNNVVLLGNYAEASQDNSVIIGSLTNPVTTTIMGDLSVADRFRFNSITATLTTFSQPVTATGDFMVLNINGNNRAIRLWQYE